MFINNRYFLCIVFRYAQKACWKDFFWTERIFLIKPKVFLKKHAQSDRFSLRTPFERSEKQCVKSGVYLTTYLHR